MLIKKQVDFNNQCQ